MNCAYPIKVKNPNYNKNGGVHKWERNLYYFVPCGYCLNCMMSKRSWLKDVCDFEYNYFGCGSFTTLTYDDEHIHIEDNRAVLDYRDYQLFNKRLRQILKRKYGFNIEYTWIAVGEYGSQTERPHIHILFFGLDWQHNDKEITEAWGEIGIVKNLPIKRGGITYVLKYMDKDRIRNNRHYSENKDLRPFLKHSVGIANKFIKAHLEEIILNYGCYSLDNGQNWKPIPSYFVRKLCIDVPKDTSRIRKEMESYGYLKKKELEYNLAEINEWKMTKAKNKLEEMIRTSRDSGEPQSDFDEYYFKMIKKEFV